MKKVFILILLFAASATSRGQVEGSASGIEWMNGTVHEFGSVMQNKPASFIFEFSNAGNIPVTITKAQAECKCTVVEFTKETILPGEKGLVKTTYNAHAAGKFNKAINVSIEPIHAITILEITGEVVQKPADLKETIATPKQ